MDRFSEAEARFVDCLRRARGICDLQSFLEDNHAPALDTSDMLRAAVVLCVSAFDFLVHELIRIETISRYRGRRSINRLGVPFSILISEAADIEGSLEGHIRESNSYKSFVDPGKFAEAMGCFIEHPWDKMAERLGTDAKPLKSRLKTVYRWRNRIAHEADINPVLAGVELWPIEKQDVILAIDDVERIGKSAIAILR